MVQFDPSLRKETWIFQRAGKDSKGREFYRILNYIEVEEDEDGQIFVEARQGAERDTYSGAAASGIKASGPKIYLKFVDGLPYSDPRLKDGPVTHID